MSFHSVLELEHAAFLNWVKWISGSPSISPLSNSTDHSKRFKYTLYLCWYSTICYVLHTQLSWQCACLQSKILSLIEKTSLDPTRRHPTTTAPEPPGYVPTIWVDKTPLKMVEIPRYSVRFQSSVWYWIWPSCKIAEHKLYVQVVTSKLHLAV